MGLSNYLPSSRISQSGVCTSTTRPASPYEGQVIYETDTNKTFVWSGSAWVMLVSADSPPGLELVKVQTIGSGVTSVTVTGAFSSTWDNYRVTFGGVTPTATDSFRLMMGSGATSGHYGTMPYDRFDGGSSGTLRVNNGASLYATLNEAGNESGKFSCDIMSPNEAKYTTMFGLYYGRGYAGWFSGYVPNTTQYTSFTVTTDGAGTMSGGTIRVYGYRNSI